LRRLLELAQVTRHLHADAAAAARCLHQQREADAVSLTLQACRIGGVDGTVAARRRFEAHGPSASTRLDLVAERSQRRRRRPDERRASRGDRLRKLGAFAAQPVSGVNGVGTGVVNGRDQRVDTEVTLLDRCRADSDGFVGERHVGRHHVGVRKHRDARDAQTLRSLQNTAGDFAAICHQQLLERQRHARPRAPRPSGTNSEASAN
jgi:hypothetical protein